MKRAAENGVESTTIKTFIVSHLSGKRDRFNLDISTATVGDFRENIAEKHPFTVLYRGKIAFYQNDDAAAITLEKHFEKYLPSVLEEGGNKNILLHLKLNLGGPFEETRRIGRLLLSTLDATRMEEKADLPTVILCPITISLVTRAFKLNDHYYELEELAKYLFETIAKMEDEQEEILCPLRQPIKLDIVSAFTWYMVKKGNSLPTLTYCLLLMARVQNHQQEYDALLLSHVWAREKCIHK